MATRADYDQKIRELEREVARLKNLRDKLPKPSWLRIDDAGLLPSDGSPPEIHVAIWPGAPRQNIPALMAIAADPGALPNEPWDAQRKTPRDAVMTDAIFRAVGLLAARLDNSKASALVAEALALFGPKKSRGNYRRPTMIRTVQNCYWDDAGAPKPGTARQAAIIDAIASCLVALAEPEAAAGLPVRVIRHDRVAVRRTIAGTARL